jgi:hypothetical protein
MMDKGLQVACIEPNAEILEFKCVPFVEELLYKDLELSE